MSQVQVADSPEKIRRCFPVMAQLRPHLDEAKFLERVGRQAGEGYRLAYLENENRVAAVAGYRIQHMLHQGRMLYVDDLVTDQESRSGGFGAALFSWLAEEAKRNDCDVLELDSGVQRVGAHRFYLGAGMHITSYHFRLPLRTPPPRILGSAPTAGAEPTEFSAGATKRKKRRA